MFLVSLSIHMISIFILCAIYVAHHWDNLKQVSSGSQLKSKVQSMCSSFQTTSIVTLIIMVIEVLIFFPIFGLTSFHTFLIPHGRTTNEQVTGKFRGGYNPFSKNCAYNCCYTLCGPQYPRWEINKAVRYSDISLQEVPKINRASAKKNNDFRFSLSLSLSLSLCLL